MTAPPIAATNTRLLADYGRTGRAAGLSRHLDLYGPPPVTGRAPRGEGARLIAMVEAAGLTGRGGGAFPTGRKLRSVAAARGTATVVVNACEGEPASEKDRLLLTVAPHLVLDGAVLAAEAVGAREIVLCAHEPLAGDVEWAVADRGQALPATVPVRVQRVPERYVASEETALVGLLNGGPARPSFTPPRPYERGVGGRPTLIGNAETYAHIALIARHGPEWFRTCGTRDAPGTALFTVGGAVARPGVVEAPYGTPVIELLRMAGGTSGPLQAVLLGGYGGAWLPVGALGTPATPAALAEAGAALGPGIVLALPEAACGVAETARVLAWMAEQTAGQCGPCVFGLPAIAGDFARLAGCTADTAVYRRLHERIAVVRGRGACRHPDGAVRFAASALQVFAAHLAVHERAGGCLRARRSRWLPIPGGA